MAQAVTENNPIYVSMMADSLQRKVIVLKDLYDLTKRQQDLLNVDVLDTDRFMEMLDRKGERIDELNHLDEGFDRLYKSVEKELLAKRHLYENEIKQMKESVEAITSYSTQIQVLEKKNNEKFERFMTEQKGHVRRANLNQKSINSYAQGMRAGASESYYFNESK